MNELHLLNAMLKLMVRVVVANTFLQLVVGGKGLRLWNEVVSGFSEGPTRLHSEKHDADPILVQFIIVN